MGIFTAWQPPLFTSRYQFNFNIPSFHFTPHVEKLGGSEFLSGEAAWMLCRGIARTRFLVARHQPLTWWLLVVQPQTWWLLESSQKKISMTKKVLKSMASVFFVVHSWTTDVVLKSRNPQTWDKRRQKSPKIVERRELLHLGKGGARKPGARNSWGADGNQALHSCQHERF